MQGPALLKLSYPDIAEGDAPSLAPLPDRFETVGDMARAPVVHPAISESDKPEVFAEAFGPVYAVELPTRPDLGSELSDTTLLDEVVIKADFKAFRRATCFK